ncbi:hypothetical protein KEM55_003729 [Ascosphaera atra]|nr:hypothetical protein KEM55_003729 [Ascosphaera atra]
MMVQWKSKKNTREEARIAKLTKLDPDCNGTPQGTLDRIRMNRSQAFEVELLPLLIAENEIHHMLRDESEQHLAQPELGSLSGERRLDFHETTHNDWQDGTVVGEKEGESPAQPVSIRPVSLKGKDLQLTNTRIDYLNRFPPSGLAVGFRGEAVLDAPGTCSATPLRRHEPANGLPKLWLKEDQSTRNSQVSQSGYPVNIERQWGYVAAEGHDTAEPKQNANKRQRGDLSWRSETGSNGAVPSPVSSEEPRESRPWLGGRMPTDEHLSYNNVLFQDVQPDCAPKKRLRGTGSGQSNKRDLRGCLLTALSRERRLMRMTEGKRKTVEKKDMWINAGKRVRGEKVKDDIQLLNKTIRRRMERKRRSEKAWKRRLEANDGHRHFSQRD